MVSFLRKTHVGVAVCGLLLGTAIPARANAVDYWSDIATQVAVALGEGNSHFSIVYAEAAVAASMDAPSGFVAGRTANTECRPSIAFTAS